MRFAGLAVLFLLASLGGARAAELTITIDGIRNDRGHIMLTVYGSAEEWLKESPSGHDRSLKAGTGSVAVTLDLPPGTYAAAAYQDENDNGKFDRNFIGIPLEGYAFSNGARPFLFTAPSFATASFTLPPEGAAIHMRMVYW